MAQGGCGLDPPDVDIPYAALPPPYSLDELNDSVFMATGVTGGASETLNIPVTRYLAPVNPTTGRIPAAIADQLETDGVVRRTVNLEYSFSYRYQRILNFDRHAGRGDKATQVVPSPPLRARFNGTDVSDRMKFSVPATPSVTSFGEHTIRLNGVVVGFFQLDITDINFPKEPGENGEPPTPGMNTLEWEFEEGTFGDTEPPCVNYEIYSGGALSWAGFKISAMAPLLLVHGIGGDASDWENGVDDDFEPSEYYGVKAYLERQHITFSHDISLTPHGKRDHNAKELSQLFRTRATELGAKGVHVVAHSKGGLDTRSFLAERAEALKAATGIHLLSLSTLSTPHHGSVLADLSMWQRGPGRVTSGDDDFRLYLDADYKLGLLNKIPFISFGPKEPGLADLQTTEAQGFNIVTPFPDNVKLFTYGASADVNESPDPGYVPEITAGPEGPGTPYANAPNETSPMIPRVPLLLNRAGIRLRASTLFRIGLTTTGVRHEMERDYGANPGRRRWKYSLIGVEGVEDIAGKSDLAVTIPSSRLNGEAAHFAFTGAIGMNHTNMRTAQVLGKVLERLRTEFPLQ